MNTKWNHNLQFLQSKSEGIYQKVKNANANTTSVCRTKNGKRNIQKMFNGKPIFIHSNYDPIAQATAICDEISEEDIIVLFGIGMAYELKEIMANHPKKKYFVIEPDIDIFKVMLEYVELELFMGKGTQITLCIDTNPETILANIQTLIQGEATVSFKIITLAPYKLLYEHLLEDICVGLQKILNMIRVSLHTTTGFDIQWVINYAINTRSLFKTSPVKELKEAIQGMPVIIVGAGPSLEYNLEHLKKIYDRAIIVAAGSGISVLNNHSIKAHFAGAIDFGEAEMRVFENMEVNKDIALLYSMQVYNGVPSLVNGPKFLMNQVAMDSYVAKELDWTCLDRFSGPSITNVLAVNFAALGCSPIILLGQDMCYSNNKNYAKGAVYYTENQIGEGEGYKRVRNKMGREVYTTEVFLAMRNTMEICTRVFSQIEFLNGTKDGLAIQGVTDIDFNEYVEKVLLQSPRYNIENIIRNISNQNTDNSLAKKVIELVSKMRREIVELSILSRECISIIDSNEEEKEKEREIKVKQEDFHKNSFYQEVIWLSFGQTWDLMYKNRPYIERIKAISESILLKCNIMLEAFNQVYGPISDTSKDEVN